MISYSCFCPFCSSSINTSISSFKHPNKCNLISVNIRLSTKPNPNLYAFIIAIPGICLLTFQSLNPKQLVAVFNCFMYNGIRVPASMLHFKLKFLEWSQYNSGSPDFLVTVLLTSCWGITAEFFMYTTSFQLFILFSTIKYLLHDYSWQSKKVPTGNILAGNCFRANWNQFLLW